MIEQRHLGSMVVKGLELALLLLTLSVDGMISRTRSQESLQLLSLPLQLFCHGVPPPAGPWNVSDSRRAQHGLSPHFTSSAWEV